MRILRTLFTVAFLLFAHSAFAQTEVLAPRTGLAVITSGSTAGGVEHIVGSGIAYHRISWQTQGTVSTCSVKLQQSSDEVTWTDLITAQTCTTNGGTVYTAGYANHVRVNATTFTGTGTLYVRYEGALYSSSTGGGGGEVSGTTATGDAFSDNPVVVGGVQSGTTARSMQVDSSGKLYVIGANSSGTPYSTTGGGILYVNNSLSANYLTGLGDPGGSTTAIAQNTGNADDGTQRVVLASNQPNVPVNIATSINIPIVGSAASGSVPGNPVSFCAMSGTGCNAIQMTTTGAGVKVAIEDSSGNSITSTSNKLNVALFDSTGASVTAISDPCNGVVPNFVSVTITTSTTLITASAGLKTYICGSLLGTPDAAGATITFSSGTGSNCGSTVTYYVGTSGGVASGFFMAASGGGYVLPVGHSYYNSSASMDTCLATNGTQNVRGSLWYVKALGILPDWWLQWLFGSLYGLWYNRKRLFAWAAV